MNTTEIRTGGADHAKGESHGGWAEYDCKVPACGETLRVEATTLQQARTRLIMHEAIGHSVKHMTAAQQKKLYPAVRRQFLSA